MYSHRIVEWKLCLSHGSDVIAVIKLLRFLHWSDISFKPGAVSIIEATKTDEG